MLIFSTFSFKFLIHSVDVRDARDRKKAIGVRLLRITWILMNIGKEIEVMIKKGTAKVVGVGKVVMMEIAAEVDLL